MPESNLFSARGVRSDHFWKSNFQAPKSGPKVDIFNRFHTKLIFKQLLFSWHCRKITFWTTFVRPKTYLIPIFALYRVTVREGSDLTTFENRTFRHPKVVQNVLFRRYELNKSCWKFNFEWFWSKSPFWDENWRSREGGQIRPPRTECVVQTKKCQKVG